MKTLRSRGFTIIEIIIVIVILAILLTFVMAFFNSTQMKSRDTKRKNDITIMQSALQRYYQKYGEYPLSCTYSGSAAASCATLTTSYTSAVGIAPIATMGGTTTYASIKTTLGDMGNSFGDPQKGSANPINVLNTTNTSYVAKNSYFFFSPDMYNLSSTANLATNNNASTFITCNFNSIAQDFKGAAVTNYPHYYIIGYFSEASNAWVFYKGPFTSSMADTQWNYDNKPECTPIAT